MVSLAFSFFSFFFFLFSLSFFSKTFLSGVLRSLTPSLVLFMALTSPLPCVKFFFIAKAVNFFRQQLCTQKSTVCCFEHYQKTAQAADLQRLDFPWILVEKLRCSSHFVFSPLFQSYNCYEAVQEGM